MNKEKQYLIKEVRKLPDSEIEIEGEILSEKIKSLWQKAYQRISEDLEIPGFRKGKVPQKLALEKIGEMAVLREAAFLAIEEEYTLILKEYGITPIGRPEVFITKLAPGNNLGFKIKTAVMPEVKISDYKEIIKRKKIKIEPFIPEVSDSEVEEIISQLKRHQEDNSQTSTPLPKQPDTNSEESEEFKNMIRENLKKEKIQLEQNRQRMAIMEEIMTNSDISLPNILIESELSKMLAQFREEVKASGMEFKDYLSKIGKTEEEIKNSWRPQAIKKAKTQLILNKIAEEENISVEQKLVLEEVEKITKSYGEIDEERAKIFVETILTNEAVFKFLEGLK